MMFTVMGANGNTGKVVVEELLKRKQKVRALGRSKEKLESLARLGAEIMTGDATDARFLTEAFRGAQGVYTLIPPNFATQDFRKYQREVGKATVAAIREAGVKRVVFLSSIGADKASGTGPIVGLHEQEEELRKLSGVDVLALRPGYFFENMFMSLGMIKSQGINGGAIRGDVPAAMIATQDIGAYAAKALAEGGFTGFTTRELQGPRHYTMNEVTAMIGQKIGKPDLQYVTFPYADFANALTGMGVPEDLAAQYAEMAKAFNEGHAKALEPRSAANTTPTRFEDFAEALAAAYRNS
jgi:uncharacterized protein YbjT (DUF2867 family)